MEEARKVIIPIVVTIKPDQASEVTVPSWIIDTLEKDAPIRTLTKPEEDADKETRRQQVIGDFARDIAHITSESLENELRALQGPSKTRVYCRDYRLRLIHA